LAGPGWGDGKGDGKSGRRKPGGDKLRPYEYKFNGGKATAKLEA